MLKSLTSILSMLFLVGFSYFAVKIPENAIIVTNGKSSGDFIKFSEIEPSTLINADGGCFYFESAQDCFQIIKELGAKKVHYFYDGEIENYYFFTEKLPKKEILAGKNVNIHLAVKKSGATLGVPLIYYGY